MSTDHPEQTHPQAALESLAAALDPNHHITALTTSDGYPPRLTVTSRHADLAEDIFAHDGWFWWSWAERLASTGDPLAAARKVTTVLRTTHD